MNNPKQGKLYWHDAHFEVLKLELINYENDLTFEQEHMLSQEALRMDTLIIKKNKDIKIEKNIGRIFKAHNIIEYKSEKDSFTQWDYNKLLGYALIYSSFEKVNLSNITISISLTKHPKKLVESLKAKGLKITQPDQGIHQIQGELIPIQILESKKLSEEENIFLHSLRSNIGAKKVYKSISAYEKHRPLNKNNAYLDI